MCPKSMHLSGGRFFFTFHLKRADTEHLSGQEASCRAVLLAPRGPAFLVAVDGLACSTCQADSRQVSSRAVLTAALRPIFAFARHCLVQLCPRSLSAAIARSEATSIHR